MANKRMFSLPTIDSDMFIDLPLSAQALYFHLCMRADDEGFVNNTKRIIRSIQANQKDLNNLMDGGFLLRFDSGVVCIIHWFRHNTIQKDRFVETECIQERGLVIVENGMYVLRKDKDNTEPVSECFQSVNKMETERKQNVNEMEPQIKIKNRLDSEEIKDLIADAVETQNPPDPPQPLKPQKHKYGEFQNVLLLDAELEKLKQKFPDTWGSWIEELSAGKERKGYKYKSDYLAILDWSKRDPPKKQVVNAPAPQPAKRSFVEVIEERNRLKNDQQRNSHDF